MSKHSPGLIFDRYEIKINYGRKCSVDTNIIGEREGFLIRSASAEDVTDYYEQNYCPLDREVARMTDISF